MFTIHACCDKNEINTHLLKSSTEGTTVWIACCGILYCISLDVHSNKDAAKSVGSSLDVIL